MVLAGYWMNGVVTDWQQMLPTSGCSPGMTLASSVPLQISLQSSGREGAPQCLHRTKQLEFKFTVAQIFICNNGANLFTESKGIQIQVDGYTMNDKSQLARKSICTSLNIKQTQSNAYQRMRLVIW